MERSKKAVKLNVAYMDTEDPLPVPNNPDNKIPIP